MSAFTATSPHVPTPLDIPAAAPPDSPRVRLRRAALWALFGVGVLAVLAWMALWLLVSFIGIPLGADGACAADPSIRACETSSFTASWMLLMALELGSAAMTLLLWVSPGRRALGFATGLLGTGGAAIVFSLIFGLALF